jgi:Tfp pilus assembly protein PilZ
MQKILLRCKSLEDARTVKNYLETELPYEVMPSFDSRDVEYILKTKPMHLVILQTGILVSEDIKYVQHLRGLGFQHPVLVLTDKIGPVNIESSAEKHKLYFLERPFEMRCLKGLTRKLLATRTVPCQEFRRFRTNVHAVMETFISGDKYDTHMFNLSMGGAYFESSKKPQVSIGDLLRLKVSLNDMDRDHHMHGRVVWMTPKGPTAGGYGLGVKFIKSTDIYRKLLDRV